MINVAKITKNIELIQDKIRESIDKNSTLKGNLNRTNQGLQYAENTISKKKLTSTAKLLV